jgi:TatD DNase family protein
MILTDTHIHLYAEEFEAEIPSLIENAKAKGISRFFLPNIDKESIAPLKLLMHNYPDTCFGMMGLHPCYVKADFKQQLDVVYNELKKGNYFAIGEIGVDLYWDKSTYEIQCEAFTQQCNWAMELDLPIAIHCRESFNETVALVKKIKENAGEAGKKLRGVFHCFGGTVEDAQEVISLGFFLGVGGVVTFKNAPVAKTLESIGLEHIILETDGPYLAPAPFRGKRNDPEYIYYVAEKISAIKQISVEQVAELTTANSKKLFRV